MFFILKLKVNLMKNLINCSFSTFTGSVFGIGFGQLPELAVLFLD